MDALRNLELTDQDFKMINEALEHLPLKDLSGDMVGMLLGGLLQDPVEKERWKQERELERRKQERQREMIKEDIRVLQGKLITLKRLLTENRLIKNVDDMLNPDESRA